MVFLFLRPVSLLFNPSCQWILFVVAIFFAATCKSDFCECTCGGPSNFVSCSATALTSGNCDGVKCPVWQVSDEFGNDFGAGVYDVIENIGTCNFLAQCCPTSVARGYAEQVTLQFAGACGGASNIQVVANLRVDLTTPSTPTASGIVLGTNFLVSRISATRLNISAANGGWYSLATMTQRPDSDDRLSCCQSAPIERQPISVYTYYSDSNCSGSVIGVRAVRYDCFSDVGCLNGVTRSCSSSVPPKPAELPISILTYNPGPSVEPFKGCFGDAIIGEYYAEGACIVGGSPVYLLNGKYSCQGGKLFQEFGSGSSCTGREKISSNQGCSVASSTGQSFIRCGAANAFSVAYLVLFLVSLIMVL